ncbi:MAG TPA: SRPBCC domain-containing protein [Gammaproteobacteria bacterium]|nr:SRPBCC domain-containing protein [Gammaproteobacteria bacterium]
MKLGARIGLAAIVAALLLVGVPYLAGAILPREHVVTVTREYPYSVALVWSLLDAPEARADWSERVVGVEIVAIDEHGLPMWRERYDDGWVLTLQRVESVPLRRIVTRVVDEGQPFGGTWTIELEPLPAGTRVTVTEQGWIDSPLFRFVAHYITGLDGAAREYLDELGEGLARAARGGVNETMGGNDEATQQTEG